MNPEAILHEMELAAWKMAEAESAERRAHQLRLSASKRISSFHAEFKAALYKPEPKIINPIN